MTALQSAFCANLYEALQFMSVKADEAREEKERFEKSQRKRR